ncbi:MAG: hypothetical protein PF508_17050 [Spirochaeta sp.]|jgi:hypothetical protein|nr:hypothetical protein [Spirochaeta sp.]
MVPRTLRRTIRTVAVFSSVLIVTSCATRAPEQPSLPDVPPQINLDSADALGRVTTPLDNTLIVDGFSLSPPQAIETNYPAEGKRYEVLRFHDGETGLIGGAFHFVSVDGATPITFPDYVAEIELPPQETHRETYLSPAGVEWTVAAGWGDRMTAGTGASAPASPVAEFYATEKTPYGGFLAVWMSGPDGDVQRAFAEVVRTLTFRRRGVYGRVRDGVGFVAPSAEIVWLADTSGGVIGYVPDPERSRGQGGIVYRLWVLEGDRSQKAALEELFEPDQVSVGEEVNARLVLGEPLDPRPAITRQIESGGDTGVVGVWHRPSGRPVTLVLLPTSAHAPAPEEIVSTFNEFFQPYIILGEAGR